MRFLADQCVYRVTVEYLRNLGHAVVTAEDLHLQRADDSTLLAKAVELNLIFLTRDFDLANLHDYPPASMAGVVVLRMQPATTGRVHFVLNEFLVSGIDPSGALVVVDRNKYRVRRK